MAAEDPPPSTVTISPLLQRSSRRRIGAREGWDLVGAGGGPCPCSEHLKHSVFFNRVVCSFSVFWRRPPNYVLVNYFKV